MPGSSIPRWKATPVALLIALVASACAPPATVTVPTLDPRKCTKDALATLYSGFLTFGADQPVYPPWYIGDDPANGEGFESALAYAVAARLHFRPDEVRWIRVPFNVALEPGAKTFDANLSQFSITEQRRAAVDFSTPYFDVTQAVVTLRSSPAASAASLKDLQEFTLGAQAATTSQSAARGLGGADPVKVYDTTAAAKTALVDGEVDAVVADLPTALAMSDELRGGVMVGQLPSPGGAVEQFGIVLDHGSSLTRCVSWAVESLRDDGTLERLGQRWLADAGRAPILN